MGTAALTSTAAGFGTGLSLIVAIGSQNAFVLRQGIRREAVLPVVAVCAASDLVLIVAGVAGIGAAVAAWPPLLTLAGLAGGGFLLCYAALAARRALRPSAMTTEGASAGSPRRALLACLALTWLNPHVYLDTVLLLGSLAAGHGALRWEFGLGAVLGSVCWFAALGYGARLLTPFFARPTAWRTLDILIAATMAALGTSLLAGAL
ncbi:MULTISPECIES: LysE family transporter [unclassified Streptomyces]|uniref:LysE/ArgO family amino acid transporter n=1 Tax=unclassified Streptomyces TaxID=2593676 RepID=UPI002DD88748|nr:MULTISPECIES: LysE family transporter [unclassified Streptomyces]WSA91243.1 LysE family transporter [Streptomyces sp. NBC_01795]WSB75567.1 LysE family transporter [Streptomyces sp. NBC_01775]WSS16148.1 LysE family transporter [Streptomyces sp. NBC_01186]WSS44967.1 LysE family transporter [Streptomyces sp. NBC_01187]